MCKNVEFVVTKKMFSFSSCETCGGSGTKKRTFRKMVFVEDCSVCHGSGQQRFIREEEVTLISALRELLIIK